VVVERCWFQAADRLRRRSVCLAGAVPVEELGNSATRTRIRVFSGRPAPRDGTAPIGPCRTFRTGELSPSPHAIQNRA
jgi:hypothetical protein